MHVRSPKPSNARRSVALRALAGAAIGASAVAAIVLLAPLVGRWVAGPDRGAETPRMAAEPNDLGPSLLGVDAGSSRRPHRERSKPARHHRRAVLVAGDVVILGGEEPASPQSAATPTPTPATGSGKRPARPQTPRSPAKKVTDKPAAVALPKTLAPAVNAAASTGLVRLSVQSAGVVPNAAGEPELQAKLAIAGAAPGDALPGTVTLHLRPQIPETTPTSDTTLALTTQVDMVDAPRTAPTDPALRLRVRMAIAAAPADTPLEPTVQDPGPSDGKSNVVALTVPLTSFIKVEDAPPSDPPTPPDPQGPGGDPATPPDPQGPGGDPTTPPDPQGPGSDPTTPPDQPAPGQPAPGDSTTPGQPTTDPATPTGQPAPGDSTTPPGQPATDPTTPPDPAASTPAPIPPTEILIPVGPVRPNGGTTTVPVPPDTGAGAPTVDPVPIEVIVEELPPDEPLPPASGDVATPGVQDPAPEVVAPPTEPDPGPTPVSDTTSADQSVAVVATDLPPPDAGS